MWVISSCVFRPSFFKSFRHHRRYLYSADRADERATKDYWFLIPQTFTYSGYWVTAVTAVRTVLLDTAIFALLIAYFAGKHLLSNLLWTGEALIMELLQISRWKDCSSHKRSPATLRCSENVRNCQHSDSWSLLWRFWRQYRVIHNSLRNFRTRLRNNQDRHGRKEHINR